MKLTILAVALAPVLAVHTCLPFGPGPVETEPRANAHRCSAELYRELGGGAQFTEAWELYLFDDRTQAEANAACASAATAYLGAMMAPGFDWRYRNLAATPLERARSAMCRVDWENVMLVPQELGAPVGARLEWTSPPSSLAWVDFHSEKLDGTDARSAAPAIATARILLAERTGLRDDAGTYVPGLRNARVSDAFIELATPFTIGGLEVQRFYVQLSGSPVARSLTGIEYGVRAHEMNLFLYTQSTNPDDPVETFCIANAASATFSIAQGPALGSFQFTLSFQTELYGRRLVVEAGLVSPVGASSPAFRFWQPVVMLADRTAESPVALTAASITDLDGPGDLRRVLWFDAFESPGERFLGEGASLPSQPFRPGPHRVTAVAYDARGAYGTATMSLEVVNSPPFATDDAFRTPEDTTLAVGALEGVLANDGDANGDSLTVFLVERPLHGWLDLQPFTGAFSYEPNPDFSGADSFSYVVTDDFGDSSAPATVTITVDPVNDPPRAVGDGYATKEDVVIVVPASSGVLANDEDPDGPAPMSATLATDAAHGAVQLASDGSFTYAPFANFSGTDAFTYRASDAAPALSTPASVTITVEALTPAEEIQVRLIPAVQGTDLPPGLEGSLLAKLQAAIAKAESGGAAACGPLGAFVAEVEALVAGGKLLPAAAAPLVAITQNVSGELGCH